MYPTERTELLKHISVQWYNKKGESPKIIAILLAFSCSLLYAQIDSQYKHKVEPLLLLMYESDINPAVKVDIDNIVAKTVNMSFVEKEIAVYDINGAKWFDGFVVGSLNSQELAQLGISVGSQLDSFFTVSAPFSVLPALVSSSEVSYVEIAKGCKAELDVSSEAVKAARARDANDLTGQGVIIGIVDTGIDISQPDFKDENNQTRILKIWDQDDDTGSPPPGFNYGTEWSSSQINNGSCTQQDLLGHGTGVSGIAAGNGRATGNGVPAHTYVGMAPEADLILVHFLRLPGTNSTNGASVIDGINYIIAQALAANKPWVVNLSLGTRFGPKDGTSIFEQFLTAQANNPALGLGRVIVKSAGNDGYVQGITDQEYKKYHGRLSGNGYLDFETTGFQTFNNNEFFISDAWYPELENFRISIDPPGQARILLNNGTWGNDISTYSFGKGEGTGDPGYGWITEKGLVSIHNDHFGANDPFPFTPDNQIIIIVQDVTYNNNTYHVPNGTWRASMSNGFGDWDMYLDAPESQLYFHNSSHDNSRKISEPGNAVSIITVGSFNTKNNWIDVHNHNEPSAHNLFDPGDYPLNSVTHFSSPGPVRVEVNRYGDPGDKPDVFAPGAWIASSKTDDAPPLNDHYVARDGQHIHGSGTSFSAPHVAGAVALALELNPNLTVQNLKPVLRNLPNRYLNVDDSLVNLFDVQVTNNIGSNTSWGIGQTEYVVIRNTTPDLSRVYYYVENGATVTIGSNAVVLVQKNVWFVPRNGGTIICQPGARIILADQAEIICQGGGSLVNNGGTFIFKGPGSCISVFDEGQYEIGSGVTHTLMTGVLVNQGGRIILRNGAILKAKDQGKLWLNSGFVELADNAKILVENSAGTLKINAGSTIKLGDGAEIILKSGLDARGTAASPITFTSLYPKPAYSQYWTWLKLDGSQDQDPSPQRIINHAVIKYAEYGIHATQVPNLTLKNSTLQSCWIENLYLNNSYAYIDSCQINEAVFVNGVYLYNSSPEFYHTTIRGNNFAGVYCYNYSSPTFGSATVSLPGNNLLIQNKYAIYANHYSNPFLGELVEASQQPILAGFNSIYENELYAVQAEQNCDIMAQLNWWGRYPVDPAIFELEEGCSIDYSNALTYDPNPGEQMRTLNHLAAESSQGSPVSPTENFTPRQLLRLAKKLRVQRLPLSALPVYKQLIREYPNRVEARWGLIELISTFKEAGRDSAVAYLLQTVAAHPNRLMQRVAADLLTGEYLEKRNPTAALVNAQQILTGYPNTESEKCALFDLLNICFHNLNDPAQAQSYLAQLESKYPGDELTLHAQMLLNSGGSSSARMMSLSPLSKVSANQPGSSEASEASKPATYALLQNYPNPFNPETVIEYHLPEVAEVRLAIYNILGQKVAMLVNELQEAGVYRVRWDGKNGSGVRVPSGVYVYAIRAGSFSQRKKMVLMR